jgi:hypothetical protein
MKIDTKLVSYESVNKDVIDGRGRWTHRMLSVLDLGE